MQELTTTDDFEISAIKFDNYTLTTINSKFNYNNIQLHYYKNNTIITLKCFNDLRAFDDKCFHLILDSDASILKRYNDYHYDSSGLFENPFNELWLIGASYHQYSYNENTTNFKPFFNNVKKIEHDFRPSIFPGGELIGNSNNKSIFYHHKINFLDENIDKDQLVLLEFNKDDTLTVNVFDVDYPNENLVILENDFIHLFKRIKKGFLHRRIDQYSNEIKRRFISLRKFTHILLLELSFNKKSRFLAFEKDTLLLFNIYEDGATSADFLIQIKDKFLSFRGITEIGNECKLILFRTKKGIGWFTLKRNILIEFFYSNNFSVFKDLISNKIIDLGNNKYEIVDCTKTDENGYMIAFKTKNDEAFAFEKEIILLNRIIKE